MVYIPSFEYSFRRSVVNPTAVTELQIKGNATRPFVILSFGAEIKTGNTTNQAWGLQLGRVPGTFGTVTAATASDIASLNPNAPTSGVSLGTAATGYTATVEPTYTDTWFVAGNALTTMERIFLPEERPVFNAATAVGLFVVIAPPAGTYEFWITYGEV